MWESALGWLSSGCARVGKGWWGVCVCAQACDTCMSVAGRSRAAMCGPGPLLGHQFQPPCAARAAPSWCQCLIISSGGNLVPSLNISNANIQGMTSEALSPGKSLLLLFLH